MQPLSPRGFFALMLFSPGKLTIGGMRPFLFMLCLSSLCTAPCALAGQVYKRVGEDGVPVFTDQPLPGAVRIEVKDPVTFSSDIYQQQYKPEKNGMDQAGETGKAHSIAYAVAITSPANDSAIRDNAGNLTVSVRVSPDLPDDHHLELMMDGQKIRNLSGSESARLANLDRGIHQFTARVLDSDGNILARSAPVSVAMLRATIARQ